MRLIDADEFIKYWNFNYRHQYANDHFLFALENFAMSHEIDAEPVRHGRWIQEGEEFLNNYRCSACGEISDGNILTYDIPEGNYCKHCGAKMDGEKNGW